MNSTPRSQAHRKARRDAGLVPVTVWVPKDRIADARAAIAGCAPKPMVGLFSTLSDEQKRSALAFSGDHNFGTIAGWQDIAPKITEAIAELRAIRACSHDHRATTQDGFEAECLICGANPNNEDDLIRTIVRAVLSGALQPLPQPPHDKHGEVK